MANARGRIGSMTRIQAPYFEAVESIGTLRGDRTVPVGYERNYRRGRLVVTVCPWHWRAYSHYQFWELLAAAHLAKLAGAARTALVTNDQWTEWCLEGFGAAFDDVIVGDPGETAAALEALVSRPARKGIEVPRPEAGRLFFGERRRTVATVTLKAALAEGLRAVGEPAGRRGRARLYFDPARDVTFDHQLSNGWLVHAKGFRNPDPMHELKILAGKAFAVGPERAARLVYVVDGRVTSAEAKVVALAGAHVTTPDRYREAVLALWAAEREKEATRATAD